ncbi:hypothetical protein OROGR_021245 [Orobanche gracilis]
MGGRYASLTAIAAVALCEKYKHHILARWPDMKNPTSIGAAKRFVMREWKKHGKSFGISRTMYLYHGLALVSTIPQNFDIPAGVPMTLDEVGRRAQAVLRDLCLFGDHIGVGDFGQHRFKEPKRSFFAEGDTSASREYIEGRESRISSCCRGRWESIRLSLPSISSRDALVSPSAKKDLLGSLDPCWPQSVVTHRLRCDLRRGVGLVARLGRANQPHPRSWARQPGYQNL